MSINNPRNPLKSSGGSSSGELLDIYSTEERRIGTWIDGKPLYRRVITTTSPSKTESESQFIFSIGYSVNVIKCYANIVSSDNAQVILPSLGGNVSNQSCSIYANLPDVREGGEIYMGVFHTNYISRTVTILLEYTKTTDQIEE